MLDIMARRKRVVIAIAAIALAALLLVTACAAPTIPTTEKKVVEIGDIMILTGGGGTADQPCQRAIQDYIRWYNEERPIPGVTIELVWRDSGTQIAPWLSAYRVFADMGIPLIFSNYPTPMVGIKPQLEKDQIPFVTGGGTGSLLAPPGWIYCAWPTQGEVATVYLNYFMKNWKESTPPKLQLIVLNEEYGRAPADEIVPWAPTIGYEVLPTEYVPHQVIDATVQMLRVRENQADLVYIIHMNPTAAAGPIMRDAERLGMAGTMQFAGNEWTVGDGLIAMAPVAVEGYCSARNLPWFDDTGVPALDDLKKAVTKYEGEVLRQGTVLAGWAYGAILCEAARLAVAEVGVDNVDGPAMKRALESMDFNVDGMVRFRFGSESRRGETRAYIYQNQAGKWVRIAEQQESQILVK